MMQRCFTLVTLITCFLQAQGADKYTDENRPYEFGFNIDGEQHRHEKKDENGIIMGEFGFITADGVYHVTVYATDENGNFKILSMKNIRVKPYPTAPEKKTSKSLPFPPSSPSDPKPPPPPATAVVSPGPASPARTCSSCRIPTTTTAAPLSTNVAAAPKEQQYPNYNTLSQNYPQQPSTDIQQPNLNYPQENIPQTNSRGNFPDSPNLQQPNLNYPQGNVPQTNSQGNFPNSPNLQQPNLNYPQRNIPQTNLRGNFPDSPNNPLDEGQDYPQQPLSERQPSSAGGRNPKQYQPDYNQQTNQPQNPNQFGTQNNLQRPGQSPAGPTKPQLISAQMQIVDKNTDIYARGPGEKEGLPAGLNKNDMKTLLYTFNYTVGFHGHHEEGYTNGAKKGYYFVTGRNGVRQRVDYEADENGFRPKITQEVLDLVSEDVPKEETEKNEKYGLKGYEFKWLYYPVESKRK